ncbi:hypothetical protein ABTY96_04835 [Streptomyces sp. NPDC096057]|uniref:hypothetical protein n=1 Tax=Streptomyces sp. NPDC096057 TaxID=3155543 RepID=UPI00332627E4
MGSVYAVVALCRLDDPAARPWPLRRARDGDGLNGYFAGKVATVAGLREALAELGTGTEMADHVGRLLWCMSDCGGWDARPEAMGRTAAPREARRVTYLEVLDREECTRTARRVRGGWPVDAVVRRPAGAGVEVARVPRSGARRRGTARAGITGPPPLSERSVPHSSYGTAGKSALREAASLVRNSSIMLVSWPWTAS